MPIIDLNKRWAAKIAELELQDSASTTDDEPPQLLPSNLSKQIDDLFQFNQSKYDAQVERIDSGESAPLSFLPPSMRIDTYFKDKREQTGSTTQSSDTNMDDPAGQLSSDKLTNIEKQNSKLQEQLNDLTETLLETRVDNSKIELEQRLDYDKPQDELTQAQRMLEPCATCHTQPELSIFEMREQNAIAEEKQRLLEKQLKLLDKILAAEKRITKETEVQLTLEEQKEAQKEAYLKKYGQSEGMRAASSGINLSRVSGSIDAYAAGESYTRQSGEHSITYIGRKSGI